MRTGEVIEWLLYAWCRYTIA